MSIMLKDEKRWKAIEFHDWAEFMAYAETPLPEAFRERCKRDDCKSWYEGNTSFHGCRTFDEAKELAHSGWQKGIDKMRGFRSRLDVLVQAMSCERAKALRFAVSGEWLDIGRGLTGNPECWGAYDEVGEGRSDRVVTMAINLSCSASIGEEAIFARGAVCLAAVDLIEAAGYRVELKVGSCAVGDEGKFEYQVTAKRASDPLDVDRLTFFLCHKSGPRRYGFACYEHLGRLTYGTPTRMLGTDDGKTVYVPELVSCNGLSDSQLREWVIDICREAGITFEDDTLRDLLQGGYYR
jgi:hypothetical protein